MGEEWWVRSEVEWVVKGWGVSVKSDGWGVMGEEWGRMSGEGVRSVGQQQFIVHLNWSFTKTTQSQGNPHTHNGSPTTEHISSTLYSTQTRYQVTTPAHSSQMSTSTHIIQHPNKVSGHNPGSQFSNEHKYTYYTKLGLGIGWDSEIDHHQLQIG